MAMSFKKPFRAVPINLGARYRRKEVVRLRRSALRYFGIAAAAGMFIGLGSVALTSDGRARLFAAVKPVAVAAGVLRARQPQAGDFWSGCDDAGAAGTIPIYAGEPGYREQMDGDSDGVACEPYQGG